MARKAFIVKVELDVQAVTCPGVWLCSNGEVSLQIYMLDSCVQTSTYRPSFPMLIHERFIFTKTLPTKYQLDDLNKQLSREWLYVELIQWETCEYGNVLAYFQLPLDDFLYPSVQGGVPSGSEVDLLMEPTPAFPGALAPKLEVSTKTTIEETICSCVQQKPTACATFNPKTILSCTTGRPKANNRAVCHSSPTKSHRNRKCRATCMMKCRIYERPPWRYRKVEDGFLQRQRVLDLPVCPTPQLELDGGPDGGPYAGHRHTQPDRGLDIRRVIKETLRRSLGQPSSFGPCQPEERNCTCGGGHAEGACTVCQKYSGVFCNRMQQDPQKQVFYSTTNPDQNFYNQIFCQNKNHPAGIGAECKAHSAQPAAFSVPHENPQPKLTVAQKLHERVSKTLQNVPRYLNGMSEMCTGLGDQEHNEPDCCCEKMPDMKKFYRELFQDEYEQGHK